MYSVAQISKFTGLSDRYIRLLIESGKLPAFRLGDTRGIRVKANDFKNFIDSRKI
jgi:excisionase family DNA binding protein